MATSIRPPDVSMSKLSPNYNYSLLACAIIFISATTSTKAAPTVILDAGHGGKQPGAVSQRIMEKTVNLRLTFAIERHLHRHGINTALTRLDDRHVTLGDRARYGSDFQNPIFVSLHYNGASNKGASGIETFYAGNRTSRELAASVQNRLITATQAKDRRIKNGNHFRVLSRDNKAPSAILVEGGFMTNAQELQLITNPQYREQQAQAIAFGIIDYLRNNARFHDQAVPLRTYVLHQTRQPRRNTNAATSTRSINVSKRPNQAIYYLPNQRRQQRPKLTRRFIH